MPSPASRGVVSTQDLLMASYAFQQMIEPASYNGMEKEISKV